MGSNKFPTNFPIQMNSLMRNNIAILAPGTINSESKSSLHSLRLILNCGWASKIQWFPRGEAESKELRPNVRALRGLLSPKEMHSLKLVRVH